MAAEDYTREWRMRIEGRQDEAERALEQTAIIQERILGRLDGHERRLNSIESSPEGVRGWLSVLIAAGGCLGMLVAALISIASIVITVILYSHR